jgi:hypothetical protein
MQLTNLSRERERESVCVCPTAMLRIVVMWQRAALRRRVQMVTCHLESPHKVDSYKTR